MPHSTHLDRFSKGTDHDQKRLSEIVEDYYDEGNLTPSGLRERRRTKTSSQKSMNHDN